jgi:hypothetical protein
VIGQRGGGEEDPVDQPRRQIAQLFGGLDVARLRPELELGRESAR